MNPAQRTATTSTADVWDEDSSFVGYLSSRTADPNDGCRATSTEAQLIVREGRSPGEPREWKISCREYCAVLLWKAEAVYYTGAAAMHDKPHESYTR